LLFWGLIEDSVFGDESELPGPADPFGKAFSITLSVWPADPDLSHQFAADGIIRDTSAHSKVEKRSNCSPGTAEIPQGFGNPSGLVLSVSVSTNGSVMIRTMYLCFIADK
jgi:hypothetical protein